MTDQSLPPSAPDHETHDLLLVAALAAGDVPTQDRPTADALVRACPACAGVLDDLLAIARAAATLPPPVRTRDFRIDADRAARLRSPWRRVMHGLQGRAGGPHRPLAATLSALGVVGLMLVTLQAPSGPGLLSTAGSAQGSDARIEAEGAAGASGAGAGGAVAGAPAAPTTSAPPQAMVPAPTAGSSPATDRADAQPPGDKGASASDGRDGATPAPLGAGGPWLALASLGLLISGVALFALPRVRRDD